MYTVRVIIYACNNCLIFICPYMVWLRWWEDGISLARWNILWRFLIMVYVGSLVDDCQKIYSTYFQSMLESKISVGHKNLFVVYLVWGWGWIARWRVCEAISICDTVLQLTFIWVIFQRFCIIGRFWFLELCREQILVCGFIFTFLF